MAETGQRIFLRKETAFFADSVECCLDSSLVVYGHVLCGTYQLDESKQERVGGLHLFTVEGKDSREKLTEDAAPCQFGRDEYLHLGAGVLDARWFPSPAGEGKGMCALACADCHLKLVEVDGPGHMETQGDGKTGLHLRESLACHPHLESPPSNVIGLAVEVSEPSSRVVMTCSDGIVAGFDLNRAAEGGKGKGTTNMTFEFKAHDAETWALALDPEDPHFVATGADDCRLRLWDLREAPKPRDGSAGGEGGDPEQTLSWTAQNGKAHSAGVTALLVPPAGSSFGPSKLLSGSYDETVLLWDRRMMTRPLWEHRAVGGVWRIRLRPKKSMGGSGPSGGESGTEQLLLAACHGGVEAVDLHVVRGSGGEVGETSVSESKKRMHLEEHKSMAYGLSVVPVLYGKDRDEEGAEETVGKEKEDTTETTKRLEWTGVSCSFYDSCLLVWDLPIL
uniref:methylated diphthine methylhydrolase n=1 Tax=Chromera velia CCMP2878 TaxID=1169474 RepID=A0A0G4GG72_9ALVE|eukprot:Cvel_21765.t1-p1 / transcript=Cvel_21765.t1 / gene=Cvel_21765 / organism=Chromera_velia_CCMP2878 / gene_product=WD repeat-containing protein 85 homolog, putative / transcript_product=WD repeat-containing protein 85 homolog, putative / location=Cvel_scaffold2069:30534-33422(+) / protein_length=448 / sequence_SO=supercontig / SO=protein_coding / is_pseudo=false